MMKPAYLIAAASLAGLLSLPAAATEVYKWVDENGGVHYSESPPPADAKTKSTVKLNSHVPADAPAEQAKRDKDLQAADKNKQAAEDKAKKDKAAKAAENPEQRKAECDQLRSDMSTMTSHGRVRTTDDNGDTRYMSDDEKQQKMDDTQKQLDQYCGNS